MSNWATSISGNSFSTAAPLEHSSRQPAMTLSPIFDKRFAKAFPNPESQPEWRNKMQQSHETCLNGHRNFPVGLPVIKMTFLFKSMNLNSTWLKQIVEHRVHRTSNSRCVSVLVPLSRTTVNKAKLTSVLDTQTAAVLVFWAPYFHNRQIFVRKTAPQAAPTADKTRCPDTISARLQKTTRHMHATRILWLRQCEPGKFAASQKTRYWFYNHCRVDGYGAVELKAAPNCRRPQSHTAWNSVTLVCFDRCPCVADMRCSTGLELGGAFLEHAEQLHLLANETVHNTQMWLQVYASPDSLAERFAFKIPMQNFRYEFRSGTDREECHEGVSGQNKVQAHPWCVFAGSVWLVCNHDVPSPKVPQVLHSSFEDLTC